MFFRSEKKGQDIRKNPYVRRMKRLFPQSNDSRRIEVEVDPPSRNGCRGILVHPGIERLFDAIGKVSKRRRRIRLPRNLSQTSGRVFRSGCAHASFAVAMSGRGQKTVVLRKGNLRDRRGKRISPFTYRRLIRRATLNGEDVGHNG